MPYFDTESNRPTSFSDIVEMLLQAARVQPVFSKDMAYYVFPKILNYPELAQQIEHVFLIRDPRKSILSYYKLDTQIQDQEIGIEAQWKLHQWVLEQTGKAPIVVQAEQLQADPKTLMSLVWQRCGLTYKENAFSWNQNSMPSDWKQVSTWHEKTNTTNAIKADLRSEDSVQLEFSELIQNAPHIENFYLKHNEYYKKLMDYSIAGESSGIK